MRRHRRLVIAAGALSASAAGCPMLLSDPFRIGSDAAAPEAAPDDSSADGVVDGADDANEGNVPSDAPRAADARDAADAAAPAADAGACCNALGSDPIDQATFDRWVPRGVARGLASWTELTADLPYQAGAVFWPQTEAWSDFDLAFDFSITRAGDGSLPPADGLAFVAVADIGTECEAGSNLCLIGTTRGLALLVRTYVGPAEPPRPYVALVDTSRSLFGDAGPLVFDGGIAYLDGGLVMFVPEGDAAPPSGSWQTACLRVAAGRASVRIGAQTIFSGVPVSGPSPVHWGFVGATGAYSERNAVRNVRWSFASTCGAAARCADAGPDASADPRRCGLLP